MDCFVTFSVHCSHGHELSRSISGADSIMYHHDNPADCVDGKESITIPKVTPEQVVALFTTKKKAAPKKTAKK